MNQDNRVNDVPNLLGKVTFRDIDRSQRIKFAMAVLGQRYSWLPRLLGFKWDEYDLQNKAYTNVLKSFSRQLLDIDFVASEEKSERPPTMQEQILCVPFETAEKNWWLIVSEISGYLIRSPDKRKDYYHYFTFYVLQRHKPAPAEMLAGYLAECQAWVMDCICPQPMTVTNTVGLSPYSKEIYLLKAIQKELG